MKDEGIAVERCIWYSENDKIVSTQPRNNYQHKTFSSIEDWFDFIQSLVSNGYLLLCLRHRIL